MAVAVASKLATKVGLGHSGRVAIYIRGSRRLISDVHRGTNYMGCWVAGLLEKRGEIGRETGDGKICRLEMRDGRLAVLSLTVHCARSAGISG